METVEMKGWDTKFQARNDCGVNVSILGTVKMPLLNDQQGLDVNIMNIISAFKNKGSQNKLLHTIFQIFQL